MKNSSQNNYFWCVCNIEARNFYYPPIRNITLNLHLLILLNINMFWSNSDIFIWMLLDFKTHIIFLNQSCAAEPALSTKLFKLSGVCSPIGLSSFPWFQLHYTPFSKIVNTFFYFFWKFSLIFPDLNLLISLDLMKN